MGVFDFLKKFSKSEEELKGIKLDRLNDWVDSYSKDIIEDVKSNLKEEKGQKDSKKEFFNSLKDEEVQKSDEDIDTLDLFKELANR